MIKAKKRQIEKDSGKLDAVKRKISDFFYSVSVKVHEKLPRRSGRAAAIGLKKRNDMIFYCLMMLFPIAQFCTFYIAVNLNSVILAFKNYETLDGTYGWAGFENFRLVFYNLVHEPTLLYSAKNSLILYACGLVVGVPLALMFSFYIYKKKPLYRVFKIMLFLPSIISAIAMTVMFKYFVERAIPELLELIFGKTYTGLLSSGSATAFATLVFYSIWIGFGTGILMYSGAMNAISDSVVEAAQIDGIGTVREFFNITIPLIWPTIVTFLVVGVAGIFTNQVNLFSFFGPKAENSLSTFGYYLYSNTQSATTADYPYLSSMGIVMTFIAVPLTLLVKFLLEKFGPSTD